MEGARFVVTGTDIYLATDLPTLRTMLLTKLPSGAYRMPFPPAWFFTSIASDQKLTSQQMK